MPIRLLGTGSGTTAEGQWKIPQNAGFKKVTVKNTSTGDGNTAMSVKYGSNGASPTTAIAKGSSANVYFTTGDATIWLYIQIISSSGNGTVSVDLTLEW